MKNAMHILIEMDRGRGWEMRAEGDVTAEEIAAISLQDYALSYPHRLIVDGEVVASAEPKRRRVTR